MGWLREVTGFLMMIQRLGNRVWVEKGGNRETLGYHESGVQTAVRDRLRGGPGRFQASFVVVYSDNVARAQPSNAGLTTHSVNGVSNSRCCFHESL